MPIVRLASSCAWNVPSRLVKKPSGSCVAASSARMAATISAMSAPAVGVGEHHDAAAAVLAQDLVRPIGLLDVRDLPRRDPADRRLDQEIAELCGGAQPVGQPHHDVEAAIAVDHARDDAPVRQPAAAARSRRPAARRRARRARSRRGFRAAECAPAFRPAGRRARDLREPLAQALPPLTRSVSRSSPKIFSAISARTPESRWSSRCEIGWPTLIDDRQHREPRADVGDDLGLAARRERLRSTSISDECTPSACSSSSARPVRRPTRLHLRHLEQEPLGDQADAVRIRQARCPG